MAPLADLHFMLAENIIPLLQATAAARVVIASAIAMEPGMLRSTNYQTAHSNGARSIRRSITVRRLGAQPAIASNVHPVVIAEPCSHLENDYSLRLLVHFGRDR